MTESDRALLVELRRLLLQLHKTLIDWQRAEYERVHGRLQTTQLLQRDVQRSGIRVAAIDVGADRADR